MSARQYGYPAFMTLDRGAIARSMLSVDGWRAINCVTCSAGLGGSVRDGLQ